MKRDYFIYEELKKLRQNARRNGEPVALALFAPPPHGQEPMAAAEETEATQSDRGVFVMSMTDYSETDA